MTYAYFLDPGSAPLSALELPFCRNIVAVKKPAAYSPWKILRGLVGRWPLPVLNYTSPEMSEALARVTGNQPYDVVHMDSIHMIGYTEMLAKALGPNVRIVYNWHNIESEAMRRFSETVHSPGRRLYGSMTAGRLERLEREILKTAFGHVVCSQREQQQLLAIAPQARVAVIDNGVDTHYFSGAGGEDSRKDCIVFVGTMNYYPNVEAAVSFTHHIWPAIRKRFPHLRLVLVGANPDPSVQALGQQEGVEVTGMVPDVRPYYRDALAAVVPLRTGGGTRLKILEAMAAGVPVVSTPLGAEGLKIDPGKDILLADPDDQGAWVKEIALLSESPARRQELITAALRLVEDRYDWGTLGESLVRTYVNWLEKDTTAA